MLITLNNNFRLQSPYLYCQAVGSDGTDSSENGMHVRWDFLKDLGYNHIPKGTLAGTTTGFNKPNDYVSLYRTAYNPNFALTVNFDHIDTSNISFLPDHAGIKYMLFAGHTATYIIVRFSDRNQFWQIVSSGLDPAQPVQDFLNRYTGQMEVEVEGKLMFRYEFTFSGHGHGASVFETVSTKDRLDDTNVHVIKREHKSFEDLMKKGIQTRGETIKYFRVQGNQMPAPQQVIIHTYEDFFSATQVAAAWDFIGDFSLSLTDLTVFSRLMGRNYTGGSLNYNWPRYNDGSLLRGDNFMDKWFNADGGLKGAVTEFIQLSNTDPRANVNYPSDVPGDDNGLTVSMLDMLKLVGLDYHGARMLGLGHMDRAASFPSDVPHVYVATYTTFPSLPGMGTNNDHVFMTLPTSMTDFRLPVEPDLLPVTYGLYITNDDGTQQLISDANGYSQYEDIRFINLSKTNKREPQPLLPAIPGDDFDVTQITMATSFGVEYKTAGQPTWRKPELLHDDLYTSFDNQLESLSVPERDENPLYTHREIEPGTHEYALYAVNWFSRPSPLSNSVQTNQTQFLKRNTLLPPMNLAVQYIQEEDPLIFTTQQEQNDLAAANTANPNGDNYKTRVTFDWDNLHNNSYRVANKIEFFFRDTPIQKIEGQIKSVSSISDTESLIVSKSYVMASVNPPVILSPDIAPGSESKFVGALLNTPNGQFLIVSVSQPTVPGDGPSFIVKKLVSTEILQATPDDPISTIPVYTPPTVNDLFFIFENVSEANQWVKLNRTVDVYNFSNDVETIYEDDGSQHPETVGGFNANATIQTIQYQGVDTGGYTVDFSTNLPAHPDAGITWIKGSARFVMSTNANKKKRLPVVSIQQTNPLKIVVFDPDFQNVSERIQTGSNIAVNFHPGYKLYLSPQAGVFDKTKTMPAPNVNNKKTFIAVRSADTSVPFYSSLTPPVVLVARSIQKPVTPEAVLGPLFATRPDFYGKSTYTMDIQLNITNRKPFGVVVYRANEISVLQALYKPQTVTQVLADLAAIADNDPLKFNRWKSLAEVETDPADNNKFKLFGSYRFPNPDNTATTIWITASISDSIHPFPLQAGETILSKKAVIKRAIEEIFSPLTETPIVFEYLKTGYQTSSAEPVIRSIIGRLLDPADINFNPYPMAVKFPAANPNMVRFTDYTLSGNARNIYFYFAREIAVDTKLSERTPMSGPVVLVDAAPAEKPKIRKILAQEAEPAISKPASVLFDLADYISAEKIKQYQVFRATDFANAATVRTMQLASTVNVGDVIEDKFLDLTFPPFGQPLYYRLVALRQIVNEKGEIEMIPSQPSEVVLTNVIDAINPVAPVITPLVGTTQTNGSGQVIALLNVTLRWPQTVYNGTYHLYKMNDKGNWVKLWSKKTNAALISFPENGDFVTYPQTANLPKLDANGNVIYHRFKVSVENASGLFNLEDKELVI